MKRSSAMLRRASMAANRLRDAGLAIALALLAARLQARASRSSSVKMSGGDANQAVVVEGLDDCFSPRPSMSKALRETKWRSCSTALRRTDEPAGAAAHRIDLAGLRVDLAHRMAAAGRADLREDVGLGALRAASRARRPATCGITSPARWMITVSPMRMSLRAISSSLCRVALATTTPPTVTGFSRATGSARRCGRPGCRCPRARCVACSAGNLWAMAQRGARETKPSRSCKSSRSTL